MIKQTFYANLVIIDYYNEIDKVVKINESTETYIITASSINYETISNNFFVNSFLCLCVLGFVLTLFLFVKFGTNEED